MAFDYSVWLKQAEDRMAFLRQKRAEIDDEIGKLEDGIAAFDPLRGKTPALTATGLTEAIRNIYRVAPGRTIAPTEVRDALLNQGVELAQNNPMATIHQILKRLHTAGDIEPMEGPGMKPGYRLAQKR